jgi:Ni,Fe-hydrogenase III small subunit
VLGCAVRPEAILDGILKAAEVLEEKYLALRAGKTDKGEVPA